MKTTSQLYCQYLLSSQVNYTCTNLADHGAALSHDVLTRYLAQKKLTPRLLWEKVQSLIESCLEGYLIFDDVVLEKIHSTKIQGFRRQYSGNAHGIIRGIGVVNCVYYDPVKDQFWVIDFRVFDPDRDGKTKLHHVRDMLLSALHQGLLFGYVLMDSWYATVELMKLIISKNKVFSRPIAKSMTVGESKPTKRLISWAGRLLNCKKASWLSCISSPLM